MRGTGFFPRLFLAVIPGLAQLEPGTQGITAHCLRLWVPDRFAALSVRNDETWNA